VSQQNELIGLIRQLNLVSTKTDGIIKDGLTPEVYNLSGSTKQGDVSSTSIAANTFIEFENDYEKLPKSLEDFNKILITKKLIIKDFNIGDDEPFKPLTDISNVLFFMVMARVLTDSSKLQVFKDYVISGPLTNDVNKKIKKYFNKICDKLSDDYLKELKKEEKLISDFKKDKEYTKYTTGISELMYPKGKVRRMFYKTVPGPNQKDQEQNIKDIYGTTNYGPDAAGLSTFDGKITI